jgi:hypothetical protein
MAIVVTHTKVSTIPDGDDASLIRPSDWNETHTLTGLGTMAEQNANAVAITGGTISGVTIPASNVTGILGVPNGGTGASTLTGYVKGTGTTAMTASSTIPNTDITGLGTASTKDAGAALGVATLDAGGKVPVSELPAAVLGALSYQGTWDASTNTPTLTSSVGTKGYYYVVNVAGNTNLNGITDWLVGDWAVYNGTVWQKVDNTDAGGDVVGPASATDNAIARFDTTTGKLIQNSVVTVSDAGAIAGATTITDIDYIDFDTTYATTLAAGQLGWNGNDTLGLGMIGGNVVQHIGEDQFFYCKATATITKGQVVMFTGAVGASGVPTGAPATGITDGTYIMGVAAENIANNGFGLVQAFGTLRNVNTTGYADGDILWYNPAVTGGLTKVKPVAPNVKAQMAAVINGGSAGGGTILIRINAGSTLGGTDSNAEIVTPSNGQIITYDGLDGYWKNTDLTAGTAISVAESSTGVLTINNTGVTSAVAGTGISVSGATGAVTVTNTAPDQTVALTGGTGISTSGTYPNFTITNTAPSSGGTVTSVAATVPSFLSVSGSPITTSGTLALTYSGTALPIANGGTGATVSNGAMANLMGFTSTATAAGTTTLTNTSSYYQLFTGTTTQTVVLPVTSTLQQGWTFHICNNSTGDLTVQSSGLNALITVIAGTTVMCTCIATGGTGIADWEAGYTDFSTRTGTGAVVLAASPSISGTLTITGAINANTNTANYALGNAQTTGLFTAGGTVQTGIMTLGQSTVSQTTNIQAGATASGSTKTMNIGTGGLTGSTTTMAIGSTFGTSVTANGSWYFSSGISGGTF